MIPRDLSDLFVLDGEPQEQVVVKLKGSDRARETFRGLAAMGAERATAAGGPLLNVLSRAEGLRGVEPLFPELRDGRESLGGRFMVSLPAPERDDLSALNVLRFETPEQAKQAAQQLQTDDNVEYAHVIPPRFLLAKARKKARATKPRATKARRTPKAPRASRSQGVDPLLNRQWGLVAVELMRAQEAARFQEATAVPVAVIDSGVDANHPDLQGILAEDRNFTPGSDKDTQGHGTHVIGIIAAVRNNRQGITGVCQSRKILSLKALGPYDGPGYYRAIRHATDSGARVVNFSLGGGHDPTEELLIKRAIARGIVIVAAMGNDFLRGNATSYPAAIEGVVAVGASDEVDRRASFSQTGPHIWLMAPGDNIVSTVPTHPSTLATTTDYEAWPGTSMATPFVTATVALMLAKRPDATVDQIRAALEAGAAKVNGQRSFNEEFGHGRLNIFASLAALR